MRRIGWVVLAVVAAAWFVGSEKTTASTHKGEFQPRVYPYPLSQIHPQALAAMTALQWDIRYHDAAAGLIHAATPHTASQGAAGIAVSMRQADGSVRVDVSCTADQSGAAKAWIDAFYRQLDRRTEFSR